jgi:hypothetical protein
MSTSYPEYKALWLASAISFLFLSLFVQNWGSTTARQIPRTGTTLEDLGLLVLGFLSSLIA